ncbi:hypothetical protein Pmani_008058 [Petrolisthes manimaculis]|uniref:Uncharacterized protein n=1 Tax=Petrolisthes manimaculis TaxID=1843537 RepID=A0AAE1Q741_9EUCA|nr:hypothetical protein Pmani_008058 [Petrolisthes manimaculis]
MIPNLTSYQYYYPTICNIVATSTLLCLLPSITSAPVRSSHCVTQSPHLAALVVRLSHHIVRPSHRVVRPSPLAALVWPPLLVALKSLHCPSCYIPLPRQSFYSSPNLNTTLLPHLPLCVAQV